MCLARPYEKIGRKLTMQKVFRLPNGELTKPYEHDNDYAPILIACLDAGIELDHETIAKYGRENIHCRTLMSCPVDSIEYRLMNYFYVTGVNVDMPKYEVIDYFEPERDFDDEPTNLLLECILQVEEYRKTLRIPVTRVNTPLTDFIGIITDALFDTDEEYASVTFYDKTGWDNDIDLDVDSFENCIVSLRFVQEVK